MSMSIFSKSGIVTLALVTLALAPFVRAAEPAARMNKKQLKALITNAKTPEDHMRLAGYYRDEAERLKAQQKEHEEEAAEYYKDPSRHPVPKYPTLGQHCRDLAYYYGKGAESALALASAHERMAAIARGDSGAAVVSEEQHGTGASRPAPESGAMDCTEMMANRTPTMVDMKAMDAQLDQKLAAMKGAAGDARIEAMAEVINELVSQRKATRDQMLATQCDMARHGGSAASPQQDSMSECPMMKDMGDSRSKQ